MKLHTLLLSAGLLSLTGAAQAALHDRGGGMIYDDVLDITWLQDANYAKTSGYSADGAMAWHAAKAWADTLVHGGFDDWRLPTMIDTDGPDADTLGDDGCDWSNSGTDCGYNVQTYDSGTGTVYSEMAYMFYVNLGLSGMFNPDGTSNPNWGIFGNGSSGGQNDVGLIDNLQSSMYWSGLRYQQATNRVWGFETINGRQKDFYTQTGVSFSYGYAWAVRDGDVAAIPEPETYALMLAGLGLVGWAAWRRA